MHSSCRSARARGARVGHFHCTASGSVAVQLPCYFRCGVRVAHRSALPCPLTSGLPMRRLAPLRRVPVRLRHVTAAGQFQLFLAADAAPRAARAAPRTADAASCAAVTAPLPRKKSRFNRGCRCARLPASGWLRHLADALASVGCVISCGCSVDAATSSAAGTLLRNCPCGAGRCPISFTRCCNSAVYCRCSSSPPKEISVQSREQLRAPLGSGWLRHLADALASVGCVISQVHSPFRQQGGCVASRSSQRMQPLFLLQRFGGALDCLRSRRRQQSMRRLALLPHARELWEAHRLCRRSAAVDRGAGSPTSRCSSPCWLPALPARRFDILPV